MKHAECGGELAKTRGTGKYRCAKCAEVLDIGKLGLRPTSDRLTKAVTNLDRYDRAEPR